ncbi:MAG: hypothetical protein H7A25_08455 [Leptospiraceae bacterium]|nr:hypothetical protein [Leptospiraceae bacterium]MCP5499919.1 hypothetical protein [Leptospiraceae bacterium]
MEKPDNKTPGKHMEDRALEIISLENHVLSEDMEEDMEEDIMKHYFQAEEAIHFILRRENEFNLENYNPNSIYSSFREELDLQKAEKALSDKSQLRSVPQNLLNFVSMQLKEKEEKKESLVVKLHKFGMKLLESNFFHSEVSFAYELAPAVRSNSSTMERGSSLKISEKLEKESALTYQLFKENSEEAYLCIQFHSDKKPVYDHVSLKKNQRLILSKSFNEDGVLTFPGLKEGLYNIEFIGNGNTKSFDLRIIVE